LQIQIDPHLFDSVFVQPVTGIDVGRTHGEHLCYDSSVPSLSHCLVSFTDPEGIEHSAEVAASSLFEATALGVAEFKRCGLIDARPGPGTRLSVTVQSPSTRHEQTTGKLESWLAGGGRVRVSR
jgi:hypothetical protein